MVVCLASPHRFVGEARDAPGVRAGVNFLESLEACRHQRYILAQKEKKGKQVQIGTNISRS